MRRRIAGVLAASAHDKESAPDDQDRTWRGGSSVSWHQALIWNTERQSACRCPCHIGGPIVHPTPCCHPCARCKATVPLGIDHRCVGPLSRSVHGLTKYDNAFALAMTVGVGLIAVLAVPYPASLLWVAVAVLGCGLALFRARRNRIVASGRAHLDVSAPQRPDSP